MCVEGRGVGADDRVVGAPYRRSLHSQLTVRVAVAVGSAPARPPPDEDAGATNDAPPITLKQLDLHEDAPMSFFTNLWRVRGTVLPSVAVKCAVAGVVAAIVSTVEWVIPEMNGCDARARPCVHVCMHVWVCVRPRGVRGPWKRRLVGEAVLRSPHVRHVFALSVSCVGLA